MAICKNCGKPLILSEGKCIYCQQGLDGLSKQKEETQNQYQRGYSSRNIRQQDRRKGKSLRNILYVILFIESVSAAIVVYNSNDVGSGYSSSALFWYMVIVFFLFMIMAGDRIYNANQGEYVQCKRVLQQYNEFLHFIVKMIAVVLGSLIVMYFHNYWGWILLSLLALSIILIDCVTNNL